MSDSNQDTRGDRLEPTIVPVRRPVADDTRRVTGQPRGVSRLLLGGAGIVLTLGAVVAVFFYLPGWVEQSAPAPEPIAETVVEQAVEEPRLSAEQLAALTTRAETLLAALLEQQQALALRSAASWGDITWSSYETAARLGDEGFLAEDLVEAVSQYEMALAMGEALLERSESLMAEALAAGSQAIEGGNAELAASQFDLVLEVDSDNPRALQGLERARNLPAVLETMRGADALEQQGKFEQAAEAYRNALGIDPNWVGARRALDAVNGQIADARFERLITDGFAAIDEGRNTRALELFSDALSIRPGSGPAHDGLAQAEQGQLLDEIEMAEIRGMAFERRELWEQAIARYREALVTDPTLKFAIDGLARAQSRADLDAKLQSLIDSPRLLLTEPVLEDAGHLLEGAVAIDAPGPRLSGQTTELAMLIDLASTPIDITLISDDVTIVTVYRVGELGVFTNMEVSLKPGSYTAVGHRVGYRDVRTNFSVLPGAANDPITVICMEPI